MVAKSVEMSFYTLSTYWKTPLSAGAYKAISPPTTEGYNQSITVPVYLQCTNDGAGIAHADVFCEVRDLNGIVLGAKQYLAQRCPSDSNKNFYEIPFEYQGVQYYEARLFAVAVDPLSLAGFTTAVIKCYFRITNNNPLTTTKPTTTDPNPDPDPEPTPEPADLAFGDIDISIDSVKASSTSGQGRFVIRNKTTKTGVIKLLFSIRNTATNIDEASEVRQVSVTANMNTTALNTISGLTPDTEYQYRIIPTLAKTSQPLEGVSVKAFTTLKATDPDPTPDPDPDPTPDPTPTNANKLPYIIAGVSAIAIIGAVAYASR